MYAGKPPSDQRRIYALGNTFPVPIVRWLGEGINLVETLKGKAFADAAVEDLVTPPRSRDPAA